MQATRPMAHQACLGQLRLWPCPTDYISGLLSRTLSLLTIPEGEVGCVSPHHIFPWVNRGHMQTADFIPYAPSNDWDFEQTQPQDWPLAKVPLHWKVRTCVRSLTPALPNSNRWRPEGIWGKTKAISTLPGHFQVALKSTEWCFYQQVLSLCDRNAEPENYAFAARTMHPKNHKVDSNI